MVPRDEDPRHGAREAGRRRRPLRPHHALARRDGPRRAGDERAGLHACRCSSAARPPAAAHTAVKIAPEYAPGVVHVLDASRVVNVVSALLSAGQKTEIHGRERRQTGAPAHGVRRPPQQTPAALPRGRAGRAHRRSTGPPSTSRARISRPPRLLSSMVTVRVVVNGHQSPIASSITSNSARSLSSSTGARSSARGNSTVATPTSCRIHSSAPRPTKLFADAQKLLARIVAEKLYTAKAVIAFWPANAVGDSIEVYADESRSRIIGHFHHLRQQLEKPANQFNHSLADYIAPRDSGRLDYLGGFAVTAGHGVEQFRRRVSRQARRLQRDHGAGPRATASPRRSPS